MVVLQVNFEVEEAPRGLEVAEAFVEPEVAAMPDLKKLWKEMKQPKEVLHPLRIVRKELGTLGCSGSANLAMPGRVHLVRCS